MWGSHPVRGTPSFNPIKVLFYGQNWQGYFVAGNLSILLRFYFTYDKPDKRKRIRDTFNPIKVLFYCCKRCKCCMNLHAFNPIKVLFYFRRTGTFQSALLLSILLRFYFTFSLQPGCSPNPFFQSY